MDLFELVAKLGLDTSEYESGIRKSRGSITEMAEHVSAKTIAMGNLIAQGVSKAISVIGDLGKTAVKNAADIAAEQAQFEAAFGELQSAAKGSFEGIGKDTGILASRLQNVGTKAFSQFKGAGLDAVNALGSMDKYTRLAADAAAYYDMSLEEADGLMRSFIRGNVSAGDRIGLFTSETQRNSKAMEVYGAKWTELTEAQKQMLMLNVAEDIYNQSGAIGQAAREADGWTNVTGNLQEAWRQFTGLLGKPFQDGLTPLIEKATTFLSDETIKLRASEIADDIGSLAGMVFDGVINFIDAMIRFSNGEAAEAGIGASIAVIATNLTKIGEIVFDAAWGFLQFLFNGMDANTVSNISTFIADFASLCENPTVQGFAAVILGIAGAFLLLNAPIVLVCIVLGVIITHWKDIKKWADDAATAFKGFIETHVPEGFMSAVTSTLEFISGLIDGIQTAWDAFISSLVGGQAQAGIASVQSAMDKGGLIAGIGAAVQNGWIGKLTGLGGGRGFATGIDYVPYNDMRARLHEGEAVLTKAEATEWRNGNSGRETIDTGALASAIASAVREAVTGLTVAMDGETVGRITAPSVSRAMAYGAYDMRYST